MKCFKCDASDFFLKSHDFRLSVKNKQVSVCVEIQSCKKCLSPVLDNEHLNKLRRAAVDQYRMDHNFLTSQQIIDLRKELRMPQKKFAKYLGVGEASIKRWETYYIQDGSQDQLIRLKCDPVFLQQHLLNLQEYRMESNIYNGMRGFSFVNFKNSALFFAREVGKFNLAILSKLQFYSDLFNFKCEGKSITGATYLSMKNGPFPILSSYEILEKSYSIKKLSNYFYVAQEEPDMSVFSRDEIRSLEYVCECSREQCLIRLSQLEKAFHECDRLGRISYQYSDALLI